MPCESNSFSLESPSLSLLKYGGPIMLYESCGGYIFMGKCVSSHYICPVISALHYSNNSVRPYIENIHVYCQFAILVFSMVFDDLIVGSAHFLLKISPLRLEINNATYGFPLSMTLLL